ncbi:MAG: hypothetical protein HC829_06050, partial [Bacteroidales bacterium]|nr:hypothetical protein [Bacteroidales bacterium]
MRRLAVFAGLTLAVVAVLALPALAWVVWLGWRTEAQLNPFRRWAALTIRVIVTMAIVLAIAGLQWLRPVEGDERVFL